MKTEYPDLETTVQQYVLGQLSESEAEQFEAYYLSKPDIIEMVEIAQNIQIGIENSVTLKPRQTAAVTASNDSILQRLFGWVSVPMPVYATMALVLLMSPLLINGFNPAENSPEMTLLSFSTEQTRGAEQAVSVDLAGVAGSAGILVKLKRFSHPQYQLKLLSSDSANVAWTSEPFTVSALRDRLVVLPSEVPRAKFTINVFGLDSNGTSVPVEFCHYSEACR